MMITAIDICVMYRPDQPALSAQTDPADTFRFRGDRCIEQLFLEQKIHRRRKVSIRVGLCGMLRLIRVDTLRRVNNVDFLTRRPTHCKATPLKSFANTFYNIVFLQNYCKGEWIKPFYEKMGLVYRHV